MRERLPDWNSPRARQLIEEGDVGGMLRWARQQRGWRQIDLGRATGYSASAVSRLETADRPATDLDMLKRFAHALVIPPRVLAALLGVSQPPSTPVASATRPATSEEDPMKRRSFLAVGLAPLAPMDHLDEALALLPAPTAAPTRKGLATRYRAARALFNCGAHSDLVQTLPDLLATADACAADGDSGDYGASPPATTWPPRRCPSSAATVRAASPPTAPTPTPASPATPWPQPRPPALSASSCATTTAPPPPSASPSTPPRRSRPPASPPPPQLRPTPRCSAPAPTPQPKPAIATAHWR